MSISLDNADLSFSDDDNSDGGDRSVDYLPISPDDDEDLSDTDGRGGSFSVHSNGRVTMDATDRLGSSHPHLEVNGRVSSLDLDGGVGEGEGEEDEEHVREREASIRRAFSEDDRRRAAPLTRENAARVMEAMRTVSFRGFAPDWAVDVPEERWVGQLTRLRRGEP